LIAALGIRFNFTDTFPLTFSKNQIVSVTMSSDDPKAYWDAQAWVEKNRPELTAQPLQWLF
jgi:hypothetical protein